jgi:hypothetical protein
MATFAEAVKDAARKGLCAYFTQVGKGASWVQDYYPGDPKGTIDAIRRPLCNDPTPVPEEDPEFTGGQCPVRYSGQFQTSGGNWVSPFSKATYGPISRFGWEESSPGSGKGRGYITARDVNGVTFEATGLMNFLPVDQRLIRFDGQPDDCGDPAPVYPPFPPDGDTFNQPVTYINNEGDEVTEQGDFRLFAPVVVGVGVFAPKITAPFTLDIGGVTFDGTFEISPDFNVEITPKGGPDGPGTPPEEPPGDPEPGTDPVIPEPDTSRTLLGVHVRSSLTTGLKATRVFGTDGPDLWVPRIASVYFRVNMGGGRSWLGPFDVKTTNAWFPVPVGTYADDYRVEPEPSVTPSVTPVYGETERVVV